MQLAAIPPCRPLHGFRSLGGLPSRNREVLAVLCPFAFRPPRPRGRLRNLLSAFAWRSFLASRALYAANPRTPEQQAGYLKAFAQEFDLRLEFAVYDPRGLRPDLDLPRLAAADDIRAAAGGRPILLSYADPLGLGMARLEKGLLRAVGERSPAVFILNGRGRLLCLDGATRGLLARHRVLARYRLPETLFAGACLVAAPFLAVHDTIRARIAPVRLP